MSRYGPDPFFALIHVLAYKNSAFIQLRSPVRPKIKFWFVTSETTNHVMIQYSLETDKFTLVYVAIDLQEALPEFRSPP